LPSVNLLTGQQTKPEGLDYSLQRASDVYSSMMPPTRSHLQNQGISDRRATNNQVYSAYDHSSTQPHSAMSYSNSGNNAANLAASNTLSQLSKSANSAPPNSPPQSTWTPRHLSRPEAYNQGYNQISPPSRSPSGPTYTQLGATPGTRGMWGQWPNSSAPDNTPTSGGSSVSHPSSHVNTGGPHPSGAPHPPHQPQELSDMLQMLGQSEPTSFEDLSMFNTFTE
jgi:hypothetical protein